MRGFCKKVFCQPQVQLFPLTEMIPQLLIKWSTRIWRPLIHLRKCLSFKQLREGVELQEQISFE